MKFKYKGYDIDINVDDYSQSYFFSLTDKKGNKIEESCGAYNLNYEETIKDFIDYFLYDGTKFDNMKKRCENHRCLGNNHMVKMYERIFKKVKNKDDEDELNKIILNEISRITKKLNSAKPSSESWKKYDREIIDLKFWE